MEVDPAWLEIDYYETLGVSPTADRAEITSAYRRLARDLHPDTNPDPSAEDYFKDLVAAYDVLDDPARRAAYDRARRRVHRGVQPRAGGGYTIRVDRVDDRETDLGDSASRTRRIRVDDRSGRGATRRSGPMRRSRSAAPVRAEVTLSFVEAVQGTTTAVSVPGRGTTTVRVPAGVDDGQVIRVPGKHDSGPDDGADADLEVAVHVEAHHLFARRGDDLVLTVPVTVTEAVRGAEVTVPTLDDRPVTLRIPPGTPSGRTLRIHGRGVPTPAGRGDLLVTVQVHVPTDLDDDQRELVDRLAEWEDPAALRAHLEPPSSPT